ncbi:lipoprotein-releasing system transmembrane subunit LolE [Mergibacter septicus]|uniref:lipoprotein-releasing ABC transporter permease subunit LolE n=1 Tax=Mergibacter septicus TaxID=221402 RepID=UPI001C7619C6|nr:lipoprotein-releasing ABC transporter permease subunit LolE [Mergibacter septicus]QDJ12646.1 lipoprotein-releasing system transmembrane subunit LolE [Mergibacter septicus]
MNTPFFISWRYQRGQRHNRLVALIAFFSTIGIALGVAVLIVGLSAMNGFQRELDNRILSVVPHIEISTLGTESLINDQQQIAQLLQKNPEVKATSPYVSFTALAENAGKLKVVLVKGIEPQLFNKVSNLGQFVLNHGWQNFGQDNGIILGNGIAKELGVGVGDWISLLISPQTAHLDQLLQPQRQRIQVSGILRLDGQLDYNFALIPIGLARHYLGYQPEQATGIEVAVNDPFQVRSFDYSEIQGYPQPLYAKTWISQYGYMYNDISLIRTVMYLAMVLVIGVACFNIVSTLMMAVKDKQGDIAILRTLGADRHFIKRIFLWYGLWAGMKGCLIGLVLGVLVALNLTELVKAIEHLFAIKILSDGIYFIDFLPSELDWRDVILVFISALLLSLLAAIYPAIRAEKLQPAKVLSNY